MRSFTYPETPRSNQTDTYHGVDVADPYRWLENVDSPETRAWVEAENKVTNAYLSSLPERDELRTRLEALWNFERWSPPLKKGGIYLVSRNDGLQNQAVLYTMSALDAEPEVLLDPNTFSDDGTVALSGLALSEDGKWLAYGVQESGSDWQTWKVLDVQNHIDLADEINWVKFSEASWSHDHRGFYYSRYDEPKPGSALEAVNLNQKLYYHKIGEPQSSDRLVYSRPDEPTWGFGGKVTDDGQYLIISTWKGTHPEQNISYQDLSKRTPKTIDLLTGFSAKFKFVGNDGPVMWFLTDDGAPAGKLIEIDIRKPERNHWKTIVPERKETLVEVTMVGGRFVANYLEDAHTRVRLYNLDGSEDGELELPGIGSAAGFLGKVTDDEMFFVYTSFTRPMTIYRYDFKTRASTVFKQPELQFDPEGYEIRQIFYASKDGTKIPMFIVHKKGLETGKHTPTYLYGYGGFDIPLTPTFSVPNLVWMERGGVLAIPNLRGGGEYGKAWHEAGIKLKKQNVFDDFIAAAEWLIANGYTSSEALAIGGRSNGGLLVGAAMTQRPDLFKAAIPGVGVMDMLRFNKFTIGWAWESDYGSPVNEDEFKALYAYSPYHNLRKGTDYPATMVYTADHDDRVVPGHSFKFAAALQWAHEGEDPVLIRIETKAGHGAGKPVSKQIDEWVDLWAFLEHELAQ